MNTAQGPSGFLVVDKPAGITSFDVIRELRRTLKIRKLGHSGVLDKPATGVLVVGANRATRLFELFSDLEKEYVADIWLGLSTTTDDLTGDLIRAGETAPPAEAKDVEQALAYYRGTVDQIPPAYSLAKVGGKELYRYALAGEDVESKPKRVSILDSNVTEYETGVDPRAVTAELPKLAEAAGQLQPLARARVQIRCTGGVYVRSLARDVGADLGCGGCLGRLVRTRVGPFLLEQAQSLEQIAAMIHDGRAVEELFLPMTSIAPAEARLVLDGTQLGMVRGGRSIRRFKHHLPPGAQKRGDIVYGLDPGSDLAVLLTVEGINQHGLVELKPAKVLS